MINATLKIDDRLLNCDDLVKEVLKTALTDYVEMVSILVKRMECVRGVELDTMKKKEKLHTAKFLLKTIDTFHSDTH